MSRANSALTTLNTLKDRYSKNIEWLWPIVILCTAIIMMALVLTTAAQLKHQSKINLENALVTVLRSTQGSLHLWKHDVRADHEAMARLPKIREIIQEQVRSSDNSLSEVRFREIRSILHPWADAHEYLGFSVFTNVGERGIRPLFERKARQEDPFVQSKDVIAQALSGRFALGQPTVSTDPLILKSGHKSEVVMIAATPVKDENGRTIAALAFSIDAFGAFSQMTQLGRLGETGETYAVDRAGHMATRSRFGDPKKALGVLQAGEPWRELVELREPGESPDLAPLRSRPRNSQPFTRMAQTLKSGESGINLDGYRDYRGTVVVGAWVWDQDLGLGLATEIDKTEAFRSYEMIQRMTWIMIGSVIIGMSIILIFREARARNLRKIYALQQVDRARKELLATVSHDLKNPLSALFMANEILLKTLPQDHDFTDRRRLLLEKSHRAAEQMRRLITDLLDSAKIESGQLEIHPKECTGAQLLNQTIEIMEPIAAEKSILLRQEIPGDLPMVWVDPDRVSQVLSNLLGNAVKFTPNGGEISIAASQAEGWIQFTISDTGPGISEKELPHLFDRYWQSESAKKFGTGLGLAICKELVTAHGGRIWAESELGRGTVFHFTLPTVTAQSAQGLRRVAGKLASQPITKNTT